MQVGHPEYRAGLATVRGWNRVGAEEDLFKLTPPHNLGMPSWSGDRNTSSSSEPKIVVA